MKLKIALFILAITLLTTGCQATKPTSTTSSASTPEEAISNMFSALKAADAPSFNSAIQYKQTTENGVVIEAERFFGNSLDEETQAYMIALFENLTYKVRASEEKNAGYAIFTLEITNKDLSQINLSDYADSEHPMAAQADAIKEIAATVTKTVDVDVVKSDMGWQIVIDDELGSILRGNKQGVVDELKEWLPFEK
jgi:hypothetical protein